MSIGKCRHCGEYREVSAGGICGKCEVKLVKRGKVVARERENAKAHNSGKEK